MKQTTAALVDHAAESRQRWPAWPTLFSGTLAPNLMEHIRDVQEASLQANSASLDKVRANLNTSWEVEQSARRQSWTVTPCPPLAVEPERRQEDADGLYSVRGSLDRWSFASFLVAQ